MLYIRCAFAESVGTKMAAWEVHVRCVSVDGGREGAHRADRGGDAPNSLHELMKVILHTPMPLIQQQLNLLLPL